jgi:hypothetical protein
MKHPLIFGLREHLNGEGFVVGVHIDGRALMTVEKDGVWIDGVNPGGVAGGGLDRGAAWVEFREGIRSVLFDIALEASTFDRFKQEVEKFFHETSAQVVAEWQAAVLDVRAGKVESDLPHKNADVFESKVWVLLNKKPDPKDNKLDMGLAVAAAA